MPSGGDCWLSTGQFHLLFTKPQHGSLYGDLIRQTLTEWGQVICFGVLAQTLSRPTYQPVSVSTTLYVQKSNAMERLEELGRRELLEASPSVKSC